MKKNILKITYKILSILGKYYISKHEPYIIGITGSVGKTSCRLIINQILEKNINNKIIYTSSKNYNSELGLVFSIFQIDNYKGNIKSLFKIFFKILGKTLFGKKEYDILVLEYGVDHKNDMDFLLKIAKPNIGIFTKLDIIHLENFSSKEEILIEKFKLLENSKDKVYILDNNIDKKYFRNIKAPIEIISNGIKYKYSKENNKIFLNFEIENNKIKTNLLGEENINYIVLGTKILENLGYKLKSNKLNFNLLPGRFSIFEGIKNNIIIDSSYNAGPESMKKVIENTLRIKKIFPEYKIIFALGDMNELGIESNKKHQQIYKIIKDKGYILSVGNKTKENFRNTKHFKNSKELGEYIKKFLTNSNDKYIILFKGSQGNIFLEEAIKYIIKNKDDTKKLARQEKYWLDKKNLFFNKENE